MAKDYKDHSGGGGCSSRIIFRLVFAILIVTIAILLYNYYILLHSHKDTTVHVSRLQADLETAQASKMELRKMMDSCKDQLKMEEMENKQKKENELKLETDIRRMKENLTLAQQEKESVVERSKQNLEECEKTAKESVSQCNTSCDEKMKNALQTAEANCQQKLQSIPKESHLAEQPPAQEQPQQGPQ